MTNRRFHPWAAAASAAVTFAIGLGIGVLADVDAGAAGLPIVKLDPIEVIAPSNRASLPAVTVDADQVKAGRAL